MEISGITTQVLDSLYHKGPDWTLFEIQVHARVWAVDPFQVRDEVLAMLKEGTLTTLDTGHSERITGWKPTTAPPEVLEIEEDSAVVIEPEPPPTVVVRLAKKRRGGSYELPPLRLLDQHDEALDAASETPR